MIVFLIVSLMHHPSEAGAIADFSSSLKGTFNISPWLLLVPVLTGLLIARKVPAIITLFGAAVFAGVFGLIFQPDIISSIATGNQPGTEDLTFMNGFKGLFQSYYGATAIDTGNVELNDLISTRGMTGMLSTVFLIIAAGTFGGALVGSGMLQSLTNALVSFVRSRVAMVASTVGTGIFVILS